MANNKKVFQIQINGVTEATKSVDALYGKILDLQKAINSMKKVDIPISIGNGKKDIVDEISKQNEAKILVSTLLTGDPELITSDEDAVKLVSCIIDDVFDIHVYNSGKQQEIINSVRQFSKYDDFFKNASDCLNLLFKMDEFKIAYGLGRFPDVESKSIYEAMCDKFDSSYNKSIRMSNEILESLYNNENLKESPMKR